jgi:hypothetical protein
MKLKKGRVGAGPHGIGGAKKPLLVKKVGRVGAGPHGLGGAKPGGLDGKRMKLPRIRLAS